MSSRAPLEIRSFSLAAGAESVGLPMSRSRDTLLSSYVTLLERLRLQDPTVEAFRQDDVEQLAGATGLEAASVKRRLESLV